MFASLELLLLTAALIRPVAEQGQERDAGKVAAAAPQVAQTAPRRMYTWSTQRPDSSHLLVNLLGILLIPPQKEQEETKERPAFQLLQRTYRFVLRLATHATFK